MMYLSDQESLNLIQSILQWLTSNASSYIFIRESCFCPADDLEEMSVAESSAARNSFQFMSKWSQLLYDR